MEILKKIKRFEKRLERRSKESLLRTLVLLFGAAFLVGAVLSQSIAMYQKGKIESINQEIREIEAKRMQVRIDTIKNSRYAPSPSN